MNKAINNFLVTPLILTFLSFGCNSPSGENDASNNQDTIKVGANGITNQPAESEDLLLLSLMNTELQKAMVGLVREKTTSQPVKNLSTVLEEHNQNIQTKIQEMFKAVEVTPPASLSVAQQSTLDSLRTLSGSSFDEAFVDVASDNSEEHLQVMRDLATKAENPIIRGLAEESVDLLQEQIAAIDSVQRSSM